MKIKRITLENHYILGDMVLDFTDSSGNTLDTIIIAGENGTGKSTVLNLISELFTFSVHQRSNEKITYELELSEGEFEKLKNINIIENNIRDFEIISNINIVYNTLEFQAKSWDNIILELKNNEEGIKKISSFSQLRELKLKSIFSDVEINFQGSNISSTTSKILDEEVLGIKKSKSSLSNEITQLLIDIRSLDTEEVTNWQEENGWGNPPEHIKNQRTKRFKNAFENMFESKKYKGIVTVDNLKKVTFTEKGKDIYIENLSSGEKQIVYRGSFCLKDKSKLDGSIAMVDEPEISLHPEWQKKIVPFYQDIFSNENGEQTSQLFIVTHSPFIIHNENRRNDKVIILKRDINGNSAICDEDKFYGWTNEEIVKEAFNVDEFIKGIPTRTPLIITEGKTDWKHLKAALTYFKSIGEFLDLNIEFLEYESNLKMSDSELKNFLTHGAKAPRGNKVIGIFDSDSSIGKSNLTSKGYKEYSKDFYGLCIDTPSFRAGHQGISIEQLYPNEDLKKEDLEGRRIYLSSEFTVSGRFKENPSIIYQNSNKIKDNLQEINDKILDTDISDVEEKSLALSKDNFAKNILNKTDNFNEMNFEGFKNTFEKIKTIIELG